MADNAAEERERLRTTRLTAFEDNVELLSEKRGSTRETALEAIVRDLRLNYEIDFLEQRKETLIEAVKRGLKKGSNKEQQLSATVLSLICITLGTESEDIYKDLSPILREMILNPTDADVVSSLISTLSIIGFVGNNDEVVTLQDAKFFHDIFAPEFDAQKQAIELFGNPDVIEHAIDAWNLLLSTVTSRHIFEHIIPDDLPVIIEFLRNEDVNVRVAAGEAVAFLFEVARSCEENFEIYTFGNDYGVDVNDLLDTLHGLAADKTKARAKKDKAIQRVPFKSIVTYLESGDVPTETLIFKHQRYDFSEWSELLQLRALRALLAEGLSTHFEANELLHQIFDVSLDKDMKRVQLSAVEKRMFMSPSSPMKKQSTKNLNKDRSRKSSATGSLHQDE